MEEEFDVPKMTLEEAAGRIMECVDVNAIIEGHGRRVARLQMKTRKLWDLLISGDSSGPMSLDPDNF